MQTANSLYECTVEIIKKTKWQTNMALLRQQLDRLGIINQAVMDHFGVFFVVHFVVSCLLRSFKVCNY